MKITFLTQYFPPEIGAPQARLSELGRYFAAAGHDVSILTAMPSYPVGRIFDGYGGLYSRERWMDLDVIRSYVFPSQSVSMAPRLLNYFSFVASASAVGTFALGRADFLLTESPPLFLGPAGIYLSRLKRARLIFNVSDLWPDGAVRIGVVKESRSHRLALRLEALCYRSAWLVTGQSQTILRSIESRFPGVRTFHLSNGCDVTKYGPDRATPAARRQLDPEGGKQVFVYAGLIGMPQGLDQILDAARALLPDDRVRFVFIGDGPAKAALMQRAASEKLANVRFLPPVKSADLPPLLAAADALIVTLGFNLPGAVPSKIYEGMASERPLVLVAQGEAAEIVERYQAGIVAPLRDTSALVGAVRRVLNDPPSSAAMAKRAREAAVAHFDRRQIAQRFIQYLDANSS